MVVYPVKHVSWSEVVSWTAKLAELIIKEFKPDIIVAVGRGGYVVARLLCDFIDVDKLISLPVKWKEKIKRYSENYLAELIRCFARDIDLGGCIANVVKNLEIEIVLSIDTNLRGFKALAVEEISATGLHLSRAKEIISYLWKADEVKTATLIWKSSTSYLKPDYMFIKTPSFVWFQFPWARASDYQQFAKVALEMECEKRNRCIWKLNDIIELFRIWYGFTPDMTYLVMTLNKFIELGILNKINTNIFEVRRGR